MYDSFTKQFCCQLNKSNIPYHIHSVLFTHFVHTCGIMIKCPDMHNNEFLVRFSFAISDILYLQVSHDYYRKNSWRRHYYLCGEHINTMLR